MTTPVPRTFWVALVPGAALIAFGVRGLLDVTDATALWSAGRWFVGGAVAHDLLVSPTVSLVGLLATRWLPNRIRGPIQGALVTCGVLGVAAYPLVRGFGVTPGEPSFLDRNYLQSLLILWGCVWLLTAVMIGRRFLVTARLRRPPTPPTATAATAPADGPPSRR